MPERNSFIPEEELVPPGEQIEAEKSLNEEKSEGDDTELDLMPFNIEDCQNEEEVKKVSEAKQREANDRKNERTHKLVEWWKKVVKSFPNAESGTGPNGENDENAAEFFQKWNARKEEIHNEHDTAISENEQKVNEWYATRKEAERKKLHKELEGI